MPWNNGLKKNCKPMAQWKRASLHYTKQDVAEACGISIRTLQKHCRSRQINLKRMSLTELVDFIQEYREQSSPETAQVD